METRYHDENVSFNGTQDLYDYIRDLDFAKEDVIEALGLGEYGSVEEIALRFLEKNGIDGVEKGSSGYIQLCRGILKAQIQGIDIEKKYMDGEYFETINVPKSQYSLAAFPNKQEKGSSLLISEVIEKFINERQGSWTAKTKDENKAILDLFIEFTGDVPIQSITRLKVGEFKQALMKLPPNKNKKPEYRGKTIAELIEMEVPQTMSNTTVSKYLTRVGALFDYACRMGIYEGLNPATKMNPPKVKKDKESRAAYKDEELIKLFHSKEYLEDTHDKPFKFWTPILALFTGARQNELAQIYLSDIRQTEDGIWVFDINDKDDKKRKPGASERIIPIHPFLLEDLNLLSYVEYLKAKGEKRLFPELKRGRDGYGQRVSTWFNRTYRKKCGIESPDDRKRDFHSFRDTFITRLTHLRVDREIRLQVQGHTISKDTSYTNYEERFPAKQLYDEVISKLHYDIDLSHLKNSKYVIKD